MQAAPETALETATAPTTAAAPSLRYWGIRSDGDVDGVREITLLAPPPAGWRPIITDPQLRYSPLESWEPHGEYEVGAREAYDLEFTGRDLAAPASDVLVATGYGSRAVMPRAAFETQARESC